MQANNKQRLIFDTHSHIQFPAYDRDRQDVIGRAKNSGVKMFAIGTQISTSEAGIKLAHKHPGDIWAAVGYHPSYATAYSGAAAGITDNWHYDSNEQKEAIPERFDLERLRNLAYDQKVVAIGECGLDYFRIVNDELGIKDKQREIFLQQAGLAQDLNKPLMIHCRPSRGTDDAYEDLLKLPIINYQIPKIAHFYVGSPEITRKLVDIGFYFTFGGVITFSRDYDDIIKYIPLDRILLETDCPYVAPRAHRGKRNEPAYIKEVAQKFSEIKNLDLEELLDQIFANISTVFNI